MKISSRRFKQTSMLETLFGVALLLLSSQVRDPIGFPCFSTVCGKGLLPATGCFSNIRTNETHEDAPAFEGLLRIKFATSVHKAADHGRLQDSICTRCPIHAPLLGLRVIETQCQAFQADAFSFHRDFINIAHPAQHFSDNCFPFNFLPIRRAFKSLTQPAAMSLPTANKEIEIGPAIVFTLFHVLLLLLFKSKYMRSVVLLQEPVCEQIMVPLV